MKFKIQSIGIFCWFICVCFSCEPDPIIDQVELRRDFSEDEFENAIIGTWSSAFEIPEAANVIFLSIDNKKRVKITIEENSTSENFEGTLAIEFLRPTSPDVITQAKLIISSSDGEIVLSRVYFGYNNALPDDGTLYLRNFESPHATLKRNS